MVLCLILGSRVVRRVSCICDPIVSFGAFRYSRGKVRYITLFYGCSDLTIRNPDSDDMRTQWATAPRASNLNIAMTFDL